MTTQILKQHIGYWINRLRMQVHQSFEHRLSAYDVTIAQWCILVALYDRQATSVNELATYIEVDKASISRVVERLVAKGFVNHKQGKDRRSGYLKLTAEGQKLLPLLINEAEQNEQGFFSQLTEKESVQFQHLVRKILTTVPSITLDGWPISKDKTMSQIDQIASVLKQSKENHWSYPKTFAALEEVGVDSYEVKLANYEATYFCPSGKLEEPAPKGFQLSTVAESFSEEAVKEAIARHQQSLTNYVEWIAETAAAGVSHYRVNMQDRTVTYYDKDERHSVIECVPI